MANSDSFNDLTSWLSPAEKQKLLDKMKPSEKVSVETVSPAEEKFVDEFEPFSSQIKKEPLLFRFFLWLKSVFTSTSAEVLYNEHKISEIAKNVERNFPSVMDYKKGVLLHSFGAKLSELKTAAEFFRPYTAALELNDGAFYVFLGSVVMPQVANDMKEHVDPYSNPVTDNARPELRMQLLHKMDDVFSGIMGIEKTKMYEAVKSAEWIRHFVKLPFTRFMGYFSSGDSDSDCSLGRAADDISSFSKLLCNGFSVSDELLEAFYMFSLKDAKKKLQNFEGNEQNADLADFMAKARSQVSIIQMFMKTVPMRSLGCIVNNESRWTPDNFAAGEDWFVKYKNSWKKIFEEKWEAWCQECKKEALRISLESDFMLKQFPLMKNRPWAEIWGGMKFRYELTAGFLAWFFSEKFPSFEIALKTIMVEGAFLSKDNHNFFTDSFNEFISVSIMFTSLNRKLAPGGEFGILFTKLQAEGVRSLPAQTKIEQIMRSVESDISTIIHKFGDASRLMLKILDGILGVGHLPQFDGLSNFAKLSGKDHEKFVLKVADAHKSFENALNLVKELEVIDACM